MPRLQVVKPPAGRACARRRDDAGHDVGAPASKRARLSTEDTLTGAAAVLEQQAAAAVPASTIAITVSQTGQTTPPPGVDDTSAEAAATAMGAMATIRPERTESILRRSKSGGGSAAGVSTPEHSNELVSTPEHSNALAAWRLEMAAQLDDQLQQAINWHAAAKRSLAAAPGPQAMFNMIPGMGGMPSVSPWAQYAMRPGPYGFGHTPQYLVGSAAGASEDRTAAAAAAASAAAVAAVVRSASSDRKPAAKKRKSKSGSRHPKVAVDPKNKSQYPRPPDSYAQLAANAINATPNKKAKVTQIYEWVEKTHPFYKHQGAPWWKNCIRHNLSMKKCFLRHPNAGGVGVHLWSVIPGREELLTPSRRVSYHRNPVKVPEPKASPTPDADAPATSQANHTFLSQLLQAAHDQGDSQLVAAL